MRGPPVPYFSIAHIMASGNFTKWEYVTNCTKLCITLSQNNLSWKFNSVIIIMPPIMPILEAAAAAACANLRVIAESGSGGGESWKQNKNYCCDNKYVIIYFEPIILFLDILSLKEHFSLKIQQIWWWRNEVGPYCQNWVKNESNQIK